MIKYLLLAASTCLVFACGNTASSQDSKTLKLEKSDEEKVKVEKFILRGETHWESILDMRLSLIPVPANKVFAAIMDIDANHYFALTTKSHYQKETYYFLNEGDFIKFKIGGIFDTYYAEILDFASGTPVGKVLYNQPATDYPSLPYRIHDICTGNYEKACTLTFDKQTDQFKIRMNEISEEN